MQSAKTNGSTRPRPIPFARAATCKKPQPGIGGFGTVRAYELEQRIYTEGEGATHFFEVQSGAVRVAALLRDGHRQIVSFAFPGDVFGVESGRNHRFGAEALTPSTLIVFRNTSLLGDKQVERYLAGKVATAVTQALDRLQDHVVLLGRRSAVERIAAFLCRMSDRLGAQTFDLPMSRSDVADHLGLTIESVSRTLTILAHDGIIETPNGRRTISVLNQHQLVQRSGYITLTA